LVGEGVAHLAVHFVTVEMGGVLVFSCHRRSSAF